MAETHRVVSRSKLEMVEIGSNDNAMSVIAPDPHGHAAILLVESLIHYMVACRIIDIIDAVEIVDIAAEVKEEIADDLGDTPTTKAKSPALLGRIKASLSANLPRD